MYLQTAMAQCGRPVIKLSTGLPCIVFFHHPLFLPKFLFSHLLYSLLLRFAMPKIQRIGLIQVKEEGWTGFSKGWQGCSEGFAEGLCRGHEIYEVKQGLAMLVLGWVTAWCKHFNLSVFFGLQVPFAWNCKLATLLQKRKLCMKHREYNGLSLLLLERLYCIHHGVTN